MLYSEIADTLSRMGKYAEAATTVSRSDRQVSQREVGPRPGRPRRFPRRAGHNEALKPTVSEAMKLDPADGDSQVNARQPAERDRPGRRRGRRSCARRASASRTTRSTS